MLSLSEGEFAVKLARQSIEAHLKGGNARPQSNAPASFSEKLGVFVTLEHFPSKELRGCIGFPQPVAPLAEGIAEAAVLAATEDPRFPKVEARELPNLVIEVSVLTKPEQIVCKNPKDILKQVKVGRDGLTVSEGYFSGLLLPQVPVEHNWKEDEFLAQTCWKAGLPPDSWLKPNVKVCRFQAQVFSEETPGGKVVEKKLG
jgi:uncharacterized protein (TIGR00296 family)